MNAKLTAFAMLSALLMGGGHAQDDSKRRSGAREEGRLLIFFPYDVATADIKRWISSAGDHGLSQTDLVLVASNPAAMDEGRLIDIAQAVRSAAKGQTFSLVTEDSARLLRDWGVRRLPAFAFVTPGRVHLWQGDGRWEAILSCGSSK